MKKLAVVMLLAVVFCLPVVSVFAGERTNLELIPKVGWLFNPETKVTNGKESLATYKDSTFSAGADMFFDLQNNMFVGFGFMWGNNHRFTDRNKNKIGFTNIYAALKYKFLVNGNEQSPIYLYPLINLGIAAPGWEAEFKNGIENYEITAGFYWGVGLGIEVHNVILEVLYACDYAKEKYDARSFGRSIPKDDDITYTAFRINIGYKFNL
jgi:hypothetical protein